MERSVRYIPDIFPEWSNILEYFSGHAARGAKYDYLGENVENRVYVEVSLRPEAQQRTQLLPERECSFFMSFIYFYGEDSSFYRDLLVGARSKNV